MKSSLFLAVETRSDFERVCPGWAPRQSLSKSISEKHAGDEAGQELYTHTPQWTWEITSPRTKKHNMRKVDLTLEAKFTLLRARVSFLPRMTPVTLDRSGQSNRWYCSQGKFCPKDFCAQGTQSLPPLFCGQGDPFSFHLMF